jgi:hypothetical protein
MDGDQQQRLSSLFRRLLTRPPTTEEAQALRDFQATQLARLQRHEIDAAKVGGPGATAEAAAWAMTARVLMNLDEAITKP